MRGALDGPWDDILIWLRCLVTLLSIEVAVRYGYWWAVSLRGSTSRIRPHILGTAQISAGLAAFAVYGILIASTIPPPGWRLWFFIVADIWMASAFLFSLTTCWLISNEYSVVRCWIEVGVRMLAAAVMYYFVYYRTIWGV